MDGSRGGRQAKDALFDALAPVARALSSGRRAEIVELLAQGERTVEEIAGAIEQTVANTSHHLRALARRLDDLPEDAPVVAYCRGPYCVYADDAVRLLTRSGRAAVRLEDFPEWRNARLPVARAAR